MIQDWALANAKDIVAALALLGGGYKMFKTVKSIEDNVSKLPAFKTELDQMNQLLNQIQNLVKAGSSDNILARIESLANENLMIHKKEQAVRELIHQPFFECSTNGYLIRLNDSMCDLIGMAREKATGYGWMGIVHPVEQEKMVREWESFIRFGKEFSGSYLTVDKKRLIPLAKIERNDKNEPVFIIGTVKIAA